MEIIEQTRFLLTTHKYVKQELKETKKAFENLMHQQHSTPYYDPYKKSTRQALSALREQIQRLEARVELNDRYWLELCN